MDIDLQNKDINNEYVDENNINENEQDYDTDDYDDTDILISLSQCGGIDVKIDQNIMIIPNNFIPYDIDSKIIYLSKKYTVKK